MRKMWTPVRTPANSAADGGSGYGFGWSISSVNGRRLVSHVGEWQGFTASIHRFVDDKLTVIVLANLAGARVEKIAMTVAGLVEPKLRARRAPTGVH